MAWKYRQTQGLKTSKSPVQSGNAVSGTTHTINMPENLAFGDLLISFVSFNTGDVISVPAGWTLAYPSTAGTSSRSFIYYKRVNNTPEPSHNLTTGSNKTFCAHVMAFSGVKTNAVVNVAATGNLTGTSITVPGVANDGTNGLVLYLATSVVASTTNSVSSATAGTQLAFGTSGSTSSTTPVNNVGSTVYSLNYNGSGGAVSSDNTVTFATTGNVNGYSITFDSNDLVQEYVGSNLNNVPASNTVNGVISGATYGTNLRGTTWRYSSGINYWGFLLAGRMALQAASSASTGTPGYLALTIYKSSWSSGTTYKKPTSLYARGYISPPKQAPATTTTLYYEASIDKTFSPTQSIKITPSALESIDVQGSFSSVTTTTLTTSGLVANAHVGDTLLILSGVGNGSFGTITANTTTSITVNSWTGAQPSGSGTYAIKSYFYTLAIYNREGGMTILPAADTGITSENRLYTANYAPGGTTYTGNTPPNPYNGATSTTDKYFLGVYAERNVPPVQPGTISGKILSPSGDVNTLTPNFQASFCDLNGVYGDDSHLGVNRGDYLSRYQIQVRLAAFPNTIIWDSGNIDSSSTEQSNNLSEKIYTGPTLLNNTSYEWSIRHADSCDEWSDWSTWTPFNTKIYGTITSNFTPPAYTGSGSQVYGGQPVLGATWNHAASNTLTKIQIQLSNNTTFTSSAASNSYLWTSNNFTLSSPVNAGFLFQVPWSNLTWTAASETPTFTSLAQNQTYYFRFKGEDSAGLVMPNWSSTGSFKTNAAPNTPTDLKNDQTAVASSFITTGTINLNFSGTDPDDSNVSGLIGKIKLINGAYSVIIDALYQGSGTYASRFLNTVDFNSAQYNAAPTGLYTWNAYMYDGFLYSGNTTDINTAAYQSGTFRYSAAGYFTPSSPLTYITSSYNRVSYAPSFSFTWNNPKSLRSLSTLRVFIYSDSSGVMQTTPLRSSGDISVNIAPNTLVTKTWSELNLGADLFSNQFYWYKLEGVDQDGLASVVMEPIRFKTDDDPEIPSGPNIANTVVTTYPKLSMSIITDSDDGPGKSANLVGKIKITRPDGTIVENLNATWDNSAFSYQTTSSEITAYGTYQWAMTGYDGIYYSGRNKTLATATYSISYNFIYSAKGTITSHNPDAFSGLGKACSPTPTFSGVWNSVAGVSMTQLRVQISATNNFNNPGFDSGPVNLPFNVAPGNPFSMTWASLGFQNALSSGSYYYYRMVGIDTNGLEGHYLGTQYIKVDESPSIPVLESPANNAVVVVYPVLEVTITDVDSTTAGITPIFQITPPKGSAITVNGFLYDAATKKYRFQTTSSEITLYGNYYWKATSYDGIYYAGGALSLNSATYSGTRMFKYAAKGVISNPSTYYPVSGISVAYNIPTFQATWASNSASTLSSVTVEIYNSTGISLIGTNTQTLNILDKSTFNFSWPTALSSGTYQFRIQGTDSDGITTDWTSKTTFKINSAPSAPTVNVSGGFGSTLDVTISGTFVDANIVDGDKLKEYNIKISNIIDGGGFSQYVVLSNQTYIPTPTQKSNGVYSQVFNSALFGRGQLYAVEVSTTDEFNIVGATSPESIFVWQPTQLKNMNLSLKATAQIGVPRELDMPPATCVVGPGSSCRVDGFIVPSAPTSKEVISKGHLINSSSVYTNMDSTAYIQNTNTIMGDTFISVPGQSGRLIKYPGNLDWSVKTGWFVADSENTDGSSFVGANYAIPYQFTVSGNYVPKAIGIAYNSLVPSGTGSNGGGVATIYLKRFENNGWNIIYSKQITTAQLKQSGKSTQYGQTPTWLMIPITGNVILENNDVCCVDISQSGIGANYLVTPNSVGQDGVVGNVLNCIMVSNYNPAVIDSRPWMLPNWLIEETQQQTKLLFTSAPYFPIESIVTSVDCPLEFYADASVTLEISNLLIINGGLTMNPETGRYHKIIMGSQSGIIANSTLNLRGTIKTRYALLQEFIRGSVSTLTLDRSPVEWRSDDELYIQDGLYGVKKNRVKINSVNGNIVTLKNTLNMDTPAGSYVVNITRNAEIKSLYGDANIAIFDNASVQWRRCSLIDFAGNPVFNPGPYTSVYLEDVVFETGANTASGLELDPAHTVDNLTIIADEITSLGRNYVPETALRTNGDWSHLGEIILIDSGTIAPTADLKIKLILINPHYSYPRPTITMSSETTLTAEIIAKFIPVSTPIIGCVEGNTEKIILNNSSFSYLNNIGSYGIVDIGAESVLYSLEINNSTSNYPWLSMQSGSVLANAVINGSKNTAKAMVLSDQPILAQISDPMNPDPPSIYIAKSTGESWDVSGFDGSGFAGNSKISTKYNLQTPEGFTTILTNVPGGTGSTRYFEAVPGKTFVDEIGRHPLLPQEQIVLRILLKGSGSFILTMPSSVSNMPTIKTIENFNSPSNWSIIEINMYANQSGVATLYVSTTSSCWIDKIQRII